MNFPDELIYKILSHISTFHDALNLQASCKTFYQDKIITNIIKERKDYKLYFHDYYLILILCTRYLNINVQKNIFIEMKKHYFLRELREKFAIFLKYKKGLSSILIKNDKSVYETNYEDIKTIKHVFDENYPIKVSKSFGMIECNCNAEYCKNEKYKVDYFSIYQFKNLSLGMRNGYMYFINNLNTKLTNHNIITELFV
jgi:hypothetical protein